jgi:eukaryotic-like serine/threonine-protein kinase
MTAGEKLGPYEILAPIGEGGMGEVWKARDTRLDRIVALKVSKAQFSERFEREARSIAALNHPHICQLYDVGPNYLVMEYIEGAALKGPLSLDQVLKYAAQICDALDAAHKKSVTHRDLKPGNILVTKAGVKLLDFGLARVSDADATLTMGVMGTPAYMSPEQWEGKPGDARSDIYSFGCVLYEMLTGKRAAAERKSVEPAALESILHRCLEKEPEDRWQTAWDLRHYLDLVNKASGLTSPARKGGIWAAWAVAGAAIVIALFFVLRPAPAPSTSAGLLRFTVYPPEKTLFASQRNTTVACPQFALSPDGRMLAFVASSAGGRPTLSVRALDDIRALPLPGTEDASLPFWSPDSRWIGFFAEGKLQKIAAGGGAAQAIASVADPRGGSWGSADTILFGNGATAISRVSSAGGTVTSATLLDAARQEGSHRWPQFLPDGRHFLYNMRGGTVEQNGVYVGALDGKTKKFLVQGFTNAAYFPPGYLFFLNGDTLLGQAFHADTLELSGQPFAVAERVGHTSTGLGAFSVSGGSAFAYSRLLSEAGSLTWVERTGNVLGSVGPEGDYVDFRLSPNQSRLATSLLDPKTGAVDIWLMDLARGSTAPFTFGPAITGSPVWSPDGARIVFRSNRKGGLNEFYGKSAGGGGKEEMVLPQEVVRATGAQTVNQIPWDWSPDGKYLLFSLIGGSALDLWLLPLTGDPKPVSFLAAPGDQVHGNFSPDGRLVAYSSNESGRFEIHVQTFPLSDRQWTVSNNGGYEPRWRADGREMYYLSEDRKLMAVPVGQGPSFRTPQALFQTRVTPGVNQFRTHYVPSRDGQRFLVNTQSGDPSPTPITVVLNWTAGLKK